MEYTSYVWGMRYDNNDSNRMMSGFTMQVAKTCKKKKKYDDKNNPAYNDVAYLHAAHFIFRFRKIHIRIWINRIDILTFIR